MSDNVATAFPATTLVSVHGEIVAGSHSPGLTKRELFAAMAMQGYCANNSIVEETFHEVASWSVMQADELLLQLERGDAAGV